MTPQGVFDYGYVDSWDKIEHLKLMYNAVVVSDPNPYPTIPKQMQHKYRDWYVCYFKNIDALSAIDFRGQTVYADRTRIIDIVANEINTGKLLFRQRPHELEEMISHWQHLYRTTEEKDDGRIKSTWIKKDDKQSDYPFAMVYARIGLSRLLGGFSDLIEAEEERDVKVTFNTANEDGSITTDLRSIVQETMDNLDE